MKNLDVILTAELEQLLKEVAPKEVDLASSYVANAGDYDRDTNGEVAFGIPGGGILTLIGPLALHFIAVIAVDILSVARKKGADFAFAKVSKYLISKFKKKLPAGGVSKEETINNIVRVLNQAGWDDSRATAAAELVWSHGIKSAEALAASK